MTSITDQDIRALTFLACRARPIGARIWNEADVAAEIAKLRGRSLGAVVCAVTRAAMDRGAERPSVIGSAGSHWSDTVMPGAFVPTSAPPGTRCTICGRPEHEPTDHTFRRPQPKSDPESIHAAVAALKDEIHHTEPRDPAPPGLEALANRDPKLKARVDTLRAANPGVQSVPMQEPKVATTTEETA